MAKKQHRPRKPIEAMTQKEKEAELLRLAHIIGFPKAHRILREMKLKVN